MLNLPAGGDRGEVDNIILRDQLPKQGGQAKHKCANRIANKSNQLNCWMIHNTIGYTGIYLRPMRRKLRKQFVNVHVCFVCM